MILALYGAGALGREYKYLADASAAWEQVVFIDDNAGAGELLGCRVLDFKTFSAQYSPQEVRFAVAIGEPSFRLAAFEKMKKAGYEGAVLSHPTAFISPDAELGEGTAVFHGAYIGSLARVGRNVYVSVGAAVGHDSVVGDHTRLGVNAFVGGSVLIGENVFVGAGANIRDRLQVGDGSVLAIGAALFEDVPPQVTMIGNPARCAGATEARHVYAGSHKDSQEAVPSGKEPLTRAQLAEAYWSVFDSCFAGVDFNPVLFHFHDDGWDSVAHMKLVAQLEETFGIHFKGREIMKLNSFSAGLEQVRSKIEQKKAEGSDR